MPRPTSLRVAASLAILFALPVAATAQGAARLTLADALAMAAEHSEVIQIARAGEVRADADAQRIASQRLPQVNFAGTYSRTLASEFSNAFSSSAPACDPLRVDPSRPLSDRVSEIERAAGCGGLGSSFSLNNLPFGQRNVYQAGFTFSQALYTGGRITAQQRQADVSRRIATLTTTATEGQLRLDVARAFYAAALTDRLLAIAESVYAQAGAAYDQTRLAFDAGRQPEFELLRAQVARDNQRPTVIRRRADRDVAYLRLRQLLQLPADAPLTLDVDLENPTLPIPEPFAVDLIKAKETSEIERVALVQSQAAVEIQEAAVAVAHAQRLPSLGLSSSYARVGYPSDGVIPGPGDFRTNWSLSTTVQMPLFTGRRLQAEELAAHADLDQARAQVAQARELAALDTATAKQDLTAAEAAWEASGGTIQQAERAHQIAELRNREGLSTQLELADSRLALEIAQANRAQAAHDLQVARARVALLPTLPITGR
ncbi:MAG: TolC family protein [Vicinamibacterales bacterium]